MMSTYFRGLAQLTILFCLTIMIDNVLAQDPLPEVFRTDLSFKLDWATSAEDPRLKKVERLIRSFNNRLYDATDGQWRIPNFLIYDASNEVGEEFFHYLTGIGHIHEIYPSDWTHTTDGYVVEHGHVGICSSPTPSDPEHFHLGLDRFENTYYDANRYAGVFLMEFLHSWTGLLDEYLDRNGNVGGKCDESITDHSCVMWKTDNPDINELCRPETHNLNTKQQEEHEMDCYSWLAKVITEAGFPSFQVPNIHIPGPLKTPEPAFVYVTIKHVSQIESPDLLTDGDFYARAYIKTPHHNIVFKPSTHKDDKADIYPDWIFGLAYSPIDVTPLQIRIEIWDHNDKGVAVNGSSKFIDVLYDPMTGRITGDVTGFRGGSFTTKGQSSEGSVEVTFQVTSRIYDLVIPYQHVNTSAIYRAVNSINTSQEAFIIENNTQVEFRAGMEIRLKSGFHAREGSLFRAYISP